MIRVEIDRSLWIRGEPGSSYLIRRRDGKMCCLGFLGRAVGVPPEQMLGVGAPCDIHSDEARQLFHDCYRRGANPDGYRSLMAVNDALAVGKVVGPGDPFWTEEDREKEIARLGLLIGVEFAFI